MKTLVITEEKLRAVQKDLALGYTAKEVCKRNRITEAVLRHLRKKASALRASRCDLEFVVMDEGIAVPATASYGQRGKVGLTYDEAHALVDLALLAEIAERYNHNISRMAVVLKMTRKVLRQRLKALGLYKTANAEGPEKAPKTPRVRRSAGSTVRDIRGTATGNSTP